MEKIPHKIYKEDKLVGPLTLKQFLYILGGASISFATYQYHIQGYLFFIEFFLIAAIASSFALALAFLNINGRPFITFLANLMSYIFIPKKRLWRKDNSAGLKSIRLKKKLLPKKSDDQEEIPRSQLEQLANILDTGGKMNTEDSHIDDHEINTFEQKKAQPKKTESELGLEDVLEGTGV